jgi:hypothetical protein
MGLSTQFVHTENARPSQLTTDPIYPTYIQFGLDWVRVRHLEFPLAISNRLTTESENFACRALSTFRGLAGSQPIFNLCTIEKFVHDRIRPV